MEKIEIMLTQDAYIDGARGLETYIAHAVDRSGREYFVNWNIRPEYREMDEDLQADRCDEACDWDQPAYAICITDGRLLDPDEFEIIDDGWNY